MNYEQTLQLVSQTEKLPYDLLAAIDKDTFTELAQDDGKLAQNWWTNPNIGYALLHSLMIIKYKSA